jgi:NAD(P)-dependent dehydrogenase (short-subunit alcohol dehydrogenase family)
VGTGTLGTLRTTVWSTRSPSIIFAPFLLTNLLCDRSEQSAPARVITVASNAQALGEIDFEDLQGERSYSGARAYNQSKLANVLFTYELARRLQGTSVTANVLHPGVVSTSFGAEDPRRIQQVLIPFLRPFMKTPVQGAATSIRLASDPELREVTGRYFADSKQKRSSKRSYDVAAAERLWQVSAAGWPDRDWLTMSGVRAGFPCNPVVDDRNQNDDNDRRRQSSSRSLRGHLQGGVAVEAGRARLVRREAALVPYVVAPVRLKTDGEG